MSWRPTRLFLRISLLVLVILDRSRQDQFQGSRGLCFGAVDMASAAGVLVLLDTVFKSGSALSVCRAQDTGSRGLAGQLTPEALVHREKAQLSLGVGYFFVRRGIRDVELLLPFMS